VKDELERTWKEAVAAYFTVLSQHLLQKSTTNLSHGSPFPPFFQYEAVATFAFALHNKSNSIYPCLINPDTLPAVIRHASGPLIRDIT